MKKSTAYIAAGSFCLIASAVMLLLGWEYQYLPEMLIISGALFTILISVFLFDNYLHKNKEDMKMISAGRLYLKCNCLCNHADMTENVVLKAYNNGLTIEGLKIESDLMYYENLSVKHPSQYNFVITHDDPLITMTDEYTVTIDDNLVIQALSQTFADKCILQKGQANENNEEKKNDNT